MCITVTVQLPVWLMSASPAFPDLGHLLKLSRASAALDPLAHLLRSAGLERLDNLLDSTLVSGVVLLSNSEGA